jgi:DNA-binding beta-propeller fold protein YncE
MSMIWERVDSPSEEVLETSAQDEETLLRVRAWEVEDSPCDLGYEVIKGWPRLPSGWRLGQVAGVATDAEGRYYVYHRGNKAPPLICFDRKGEYIRSWGEDVYVRPHMVKCDEAGNVWLIDDDGHVLYLYTPEGELLKTLGTKGVPGEDGSHFDRPTDIAFGSNGGFYVSDGYGNRRVARFDEELKYLGQWGSEGVGEGQFVLPHAVTTDAEGLVYVADRNRWRVQIFSPEGSFLRQWTHIGKPFGIVYRDDGYLYICDGTNARVTKVDRSGRVIGFFGAPGNEEGQLSTAHDIAVAPNGDILLAHLDGRAQLFTIM